MKIKKNLLFTWLMCVLSVFWVKKVYAEVKTPKVSIVIPIYNVEKYIRSCLDSAVNQTLKEIEIVCVDDGTPDNSGKIAEIQKIKNLGFKKQIPGLKIYIFL